MKAQVSTEYLVILAVVLVIALVVVYLVSQGTSLGGGIVDSQSQAYWKGVGPLAINNFRASGTGLQLEIQNNAQETVTLTQITGGGLTAYGTTTTFAPGQTNTVKVIITAGCGSAGTRYSYGNVTFTFNQGQVTGKTFVGQRPVSGTCS